MGFKTATNGEFLQWFNESLKLFLTANISVDERRQQNLDPGIIIRKTKNKLVH